MDAQHNLLAMVTKLPMHLQNKWQDHVFELRSRENRRPSLKDVVNFVDRAAAVVSDPVYGSASIRSKRAEKPTTRAAYVATADVRCPICDDGEHSVSQCRKFLEMNPNERLDTALRKQIYFMCLIPGHITRECTNPVKCQAKECGQRHATMLHEADWEGLRRTSREKREAKADSSSETESHDGHHVASNHHVMISKVALPFLLVKVTSPETGISVKTYALLDSGSNVSLCQDRLLQMLKARGRTEKMSLTTLEKKNNETTARVVSLRVSSLDGSEELTIPQVYAQPNLHLSASSSNLVTEAEMQRRPHLKDLPLHHAEIDDVMLLLGHDSPEALMLITTIPGGKGEPYAVRTRLGWSVSGTVSSSSKKVFPVLHYISNGDLLHEKVERFWKLELSGIYEQETGMSTEDRCVLELWNENVSFSDGHYVLPIPFKNTALKLPDNQPMAEKRLSSLKRKLSKDQEMHQKYGIKDLLEQGYAVPVFEQDSSRSDGRVRYLPHHPVINPNKEKIRIVFDCAAEYKGISLNSKVYQGEDLTNKLVAVMADVHAMFHQVRVTHKDQDALRFLWWPEGNLSERPASYKMTVHLFRGTWSPSCCTYALQRTAKDNAEAYSPGAVDTVERNFYSDDCLKSLPTVHEAIGLVNELKKLTAEGGFNLTKWTSNNPDVIENVPFNDRSKRAQERSLNEPTENRALGVCWRIQEDQIGFQVQRMEQPLTKRGILSMLSSVYDPLGLASPFVLRARRIVQRLCDKKVDWDEPIPEIEED